MSDSVKCKKCHNYKSPFMEKPCEDCNGKNSNFEINSNIEFNVSEITHKIRQELFSAIEKYPLGFHSNHEALGVIREEYKEFLAELKNLKKLVKKNYKDFENEIFKEKYFYKATDKMKAEAEQCAAMYIRFILEMYYREGK